MIVNNKGMRDKHQMMPRPAAKDYAVMHTAAFSVSPRHPARVMSFEQLVAGLTASVERGMVMARLDAATGRTLYTYTKRCVYEQGWDEYSVLARGLILHHDRRLVVASPFPKFFNLGEGGRTFPDLPFESFEKLDGSLIIIHHLDDRWLAATKGNFDSDQARWAQARLDASDLSTLLPGATYLAEAVYPENRLVVRYEQSDLMLLAAYDQDGEELDYRALQATGQAVNWPVVARHSHQSFGDLLSEAQALLGDREGFVLRFADGSRMKVKGAEYCRRHALIAGCNPLGVWEVLRAANDAAVSGEGDKDAIESVRRDIPEEFHADFDTIIALLEGQMTEFAATIAVEAEKLAAFSDREVAAKLPQVPEAVRQYIFAWRKAGGQVDDRLRSRLLRLVRPMNNVLPGYRASYSMGRLLADT